ncbi:MAG: phosphoglycerate mutase [Dehalococcoidia bacterium]
MRLLLIIFDGLGDRPAPELDGRTPLEAAVTPNLDRFAAEGISGLLHAKSPGYALGSPLALHLMFGYPEAEFPDRGPLLARARGVEVDPGAVALAARFARATVREGELTLTERFIRDREQQCAALAESIASYEAGGFEFRYHYHGRGDGLLIVRGASPEVTDTDPLALNLPVLRARARAEAADASLAARTAEALNEYLRWAHGRLSAHPSACVEDGDEPVNALITKWAGVPNAYEPFVERWGMRPASLPDEEVVTGLMLVLGFDVEQVDAAGPADDLRRRLELARRRLDEGFEFVHLHSKYPDPISHENDPQGSVQAIEELDAAMDVYWDRFGDDRDVVTVLTTDHSTPSVWEGWPRGRFFDQHGGEPGPITIRGGNVRVDDVAVSGERPAAGGGLGQLRGEDFMPVLLNAAERTNMWEMRPTPVRRPYRPRPDDLEALKIGR